MFSISNIDLYVYLFTFTQNKFEDKKQKCKDLSRYNIEYVVSSKEVFNLIVN